MHLQSLSQPWNEGVFLEDLLRGPVDPLAILYVTCKCRGELDQSRSGFANHLFILSATISLFKKQNCFVLQIHIIQFAGNINNIANSKMRSSVRIPASWWAQSYLVIAFPCTIAIAKQTAYAIFGFLNVSSGINRVFLFS